MNTKKIALLFVFILLAIGWGAAAMYTDPMALRAYFVLALMFIAAPCVVFMLLWIVAASAMRHSLALPLRAVVVVCALIAAGFLLLPVNDFLQQRAENYAKAYPERVAPLLEQYRVSHGAYPADLASVPGLPRPPRLLRTSYGYKTQGDEYIFTFARPGGMIDTWTYYSKTHQWHLST